MMITIDILPFRHSRTQPAALQVEVDGESTLGDVLQMLAADRGGVWQYLLQGLERSELYFTVNGVKVRDLTYGLNEGDEVMAIPILGGG